MTDRQTWTVFFHGGPCDGDVERSVPGPLPQNLTRQGTESPADAPDWAQPVTCTYGKTSIDTAGRVAHYQHARTVPRGH